MSGFVGAQAYFNDGVAGTKAVVKAGRTLVHGLRLLNATGAAAYLQFFDKLTADVTVGTTTPTFCIRLAANESLVVTPQMAINFDIGLVIAGCTTATGLTGAAISVLAFYE